MSFVTHTSQPPFIEPIKPALFAVFPPYHQAHPTISSCVLFLLFFLPITKPIKPVLLVSSFCCFSSLSPSPSNQFFLCPPFAVFPPYHQAHPTISSCVLLLLFFLPITKPIKPVLLVSSFCCFSSLSPNPSNHFFLCPPFAVFPPYHQAHQTSSSCVLLLLFFLPITKPIQPVLLVSSFCCFSSLSPSPSNQFFLCPPFAVFPPYHQAHQTISSCVLLLLFFLPITKPIQPVLLVSSFCCFSSLSPNPSNQFFLCPPFAVFPPYHQTHPTSSSCVLLLLFFLPVTKPIQPVLLVSSFCCFSSLSPSPSNHFFLCPLFAVFPPYHQAHQTISSCVLLLLFFLPITKPIKPFLLVSSFCCFSSLSPSPSNHFSLCPPFAVFPPYHQAHQTISSCVLLLLFFLPITKPIKPFLLVSSFCCFSSLSPSPSNHFFLCPLFAIFPPYHQAHQTISSCVLFLLFFLPITKPIKPVLLVSSFCCFSSLSPSPSNQFFLCPPFAVFPPYQQAHPTSSSCVLLLLFFLPITKPIQPFLLVSSFCCFSSLSPSPSNHFFLCPPFAVFPPYHQAHPTSSSCVLLLLFFLPITKPIKPVLLVSSFCCFSSLSPSPSNPFFLCPPFAVFPPYHRASPTASPCVLLLLFFLPITKPIQPFLLVSSFCCFSPYHQAHPTISSCVLLLLFFLPIIEHIQLLLLVSASCSLSQFNQLLLIWLFSSFSSRASFDLIECWQ